MIALVEDKKEEIAKLCEKFGVVRLDIFGSAVNGKFNEASSDLDFIYEFAPDHELDLFDRYFGLVEALEELFHRPIDLNHEPSGRNPIYTRSVNRSREAVYRGRGNSEAAA